MKLSLFFFAHEKRLKHQHYCSEISLPDVFSTLIIVAEIRNLGVHERKKRWERTNPSRSAMYSKRCGVANSSVVESLQIRLVFPPALLRSGNRAMHYRIKPGYMSLSEHLNRSEERRVGKECR